MTSCSTSPQPPRTGASAALGASASAAMPSPSLLARWSSRRDFLLAQAQVAAILFIANLGNNFPNSYPRNDNVNPTMFWVVCGGMAVAALATMKHVDSDPRRGVQLLGRAQTEEWKGWMQFAFIMYHYYRMFSAYNEIRLFVSSYVWMTGFGNFLYFDIKQDFSADRAISMWLRINYFPLLLSFFLDVKLELYYVVPLHTTGFFVTMATCWIASWLKESRGMSYWNSRIAALVLCTVAHVAFYETDAVNLLSLASDEYLFRFQSDKYSALVGIWSGLFWKKLGAYMQWAYNGQGGEKVHAKWIQRAAGASLIFIWWYGFGFLTDKYTYNPVHPYVFWMPVAGWLMVRNSSKYLTEVHSSALEFFGRITLETYVLQFHVFMCKNVQHIPIVIPGSGPDGHPAARFLNMLLCGFAFVPLAAWARRVTVTTQNSVVELMKEIRSGGKSQELPSHSASEGVQLVGGGQNGNGAKS